jgi:hypothetical protein
MTKMQSTSSAVNSSINTISPTFNFNPVLGNIDPKYNLYQKRYSAEVLSLLGPLYAAGAGAAAGIVLEANPIYCGAASTLTWLARHMVYGYGQPTMMNHLTSAGVAAGVTYMAAPDQNVFRTTTAIVAGCYAGDYALS